MKKTKAGRAFREVFRRLVHHEIAKVSRGLVHHEIARVLQGLFDHEIARVYQDGRYSIFSIPFQKLPLKRGIFTWESRCNGRHGTRGDVYDS